MEYIRSHLGLKLFISYLIVILVGMTMIGITTKFTTPRAFAHHLSLMEEQIGMGMGSMMGQGPGAGMMGQFYQNFQASFNESLLTSIAWINPARVSTAAQASD